MSMLANVPPPYLFALHTFGWMAFLGFILARRSHARWLIDYIIMLGFILTAQLVIAGSYDPVLKEVNLDATASTIDLVCSALSTALLLLLGLRLLEVTTVEVRATVSVLAIAQFIANLVLVARKLEWGAVADIITVSNASLKSLDAATCAIAAVVFGIALARNFRNLYVSMMAFASALAWAIGCVMYSFVIGDVATWNITTRTLLLVGLGAVSLFTGLLANRQPPGGKVPNLPLPPHPQHA